MLTLLEKNRATLELLEDQMAYRFHKPLHLQQALVHSSFAFEQGKTTLKDNETLEFLGDAVLDLIVGYALFKEFPEIQEGDLTRLRAALVKEEHLAIMAQELNLGDYLCLGRGEEATQGRKKPSILACAYEAVIGAIFLDGGYEAASTFVERHFAPWIAGRKEVMLLADAKSRLQELTQEKYNETPAYILEKEEGPDHAKCFTVSARFREKILAVGTARSKKEAAQKAAAMALVRLEGTEL